MPPSILRQLRPAEQKFNTIGNSAKFRTRRAMNLTCKVGSSVPEFFARFYSGRAVPRAILRLQLSKSGLLTGFHHTSGRRGMRVQ